jgi:hypothetical protein
VKSHTVAHCVANHLHRVANLISISEFTHARSHTVAHCVANRSHRTAIWQSTGGEGMMNTLAQTVAQNASAVKMTIDFAHPLCFTLIAI